MIILLGKEEGNNKEGIVQWTRNGQLYILFGEANSVAKLAPGLCVNGGLMNVVARWASSSSRSQVGFIE